MSARKVVVLAGGVGGARMAIGFARELPGADLSVIVNVGDDEDFHGLRVCPDLDTVLYTLSGRVDPAQGWGVTDDATRALDVLRTLESPGAWMKLGDADLGLHIYRSAQLRQGRRLTEVMAHVAARFGVACRLLPVSDADCPTLVETQQGTSRFQEWFVRDRGGPEVRRLVFDAAARAEVTQEVRTALAAADLVVLAPSNPFLSVRPMLAVGGMRQALQSAAARKIAVSPLVRGQAVKGPLVKLMQDLGVEASNAAIVREYQGLVDAFVVDESHASEVAALAAASPLQVLALPTMIAEPPRAQVLAQQLLAWAASRREGRA